LELTGISGVTDIVGEVIAKGGVQLKDLGFTDTQADELATRAR